MSNVTSKNDTIMRHDGADNRSMTAGVDAQTKGMRGGFSVFDFVIWLVLASGAIGAIVIASDGASDTMDANTIKSDYNLVSKATQQFYQNNYAYPKGSGWTWNAGGIYLEPKIQAKGWTYDCTVSTITITTPPIADTKTRTKLQQAFAMNTDGVALSGTSLALTLNDSPCP